MNTYKRNTCAPIPPNAKPITLEQAKQLKRGTILNVQLDKTVDGQSVFVSNADGSPARYKVTSVKTWKTRPDEVEITVQWGLKTWFHIHEYQLLLLYVQG